MRKLFTALLLVVIALALSTRVTWEGGWVDSAVSAFFSKRSGLTLRFRRASVKHWNRVRFDSLEIFTDAHPGPVVSGPGLVKLGKGELVLQLEDLVFPAGFIPSGSVPFLSKADFLNRPLSMERFKVSVTQKPGRLGYHLLECASSELNLKGGLTLGSSGILKLHALIFISDPLLEGVSRQLRSRLIQRSQGWLGVRVQYHAHKLTALGGQGPFFEADWR